MSKGPSSFGFTQNLTLALACCRVPDSFPQDLASCKDRFDLLEFINGTMAAWGPAELATHAELEEREKIVSLNIGLLGRAEQELAEMVNIRQLSSSSQSKHLCFLIPQPNAQYLQHRL